MTEITRHPLCWTVNQKRTEFWSRKQPRRQRKLFKQTRP